MVVKSPTSDSTSGIFAATVGPRADTVKGPAAYPERVAPVHGSMMVKLMSAKFFVRVTPLSGFSSTIVAVS